MNDELDELAHVIADAECHDDPNEAPRPNEIADAILAAGYRKRRTIATFKELNALPMGSVILDQEDCVGRIAAHDHIGRTIYWAEEGGDWSMSSVAFPAVVIYVPEVQA